MTLIEPGEGKRAFVVCAIGWGLILAGLYGLYQLACLVGASFPLFTIGGF